MDHQNMGVRSCTTSLEDKPGRHSTPFGGLDCGSYWNGCPEKFTTMIERLHTGMMVNVRNGWEVLDIFAITNGVKKGCVLDATLFYIFLSAMFEEAFRDMVCHCIMKVWLEDQHKTVMFQLYNGHGGCH